MLESNGTADHAFTRERQAPDHLPVIVHNHRIASHHCPNGLGANYAAHVRSYHITQRCEGTCAIGEFEPALRNSGLRERGTYDDFSAIPLDRSEVFRMVPIVTD